MLGGPHLAFGGAAGGGGGGGGVSPVGAWLSTGWYGARALTFQQFTRGRIYFTPFNALTTFTAKAMGVVIRSGVHTTVVRLGVYADTGHGKPGNLVKDFGTVSTAVGTDNQAIILGNLTLAPGNYWLACVPQKGASSLSADLLTTDGRAAYYDCHLGATLSLPAYRVVYSWVTLTFTTTVTLPAVAPTVTPIQYTGQAVLPVPATYIQSA